MSTQGQDHRHDRVPIRRLPTGVPGLDEILGGGLPEYSFNIVAGAPGSGKTTLAHQLMFANATPERPALYFTVLGEPAIKMLRYQQQFTFFDQSKLDGAIRFINLSQLVLEKDLGAVLDAIIKEVEASSAKIVVVDSFRTVVRKALSSASEMELQGFVQRLALHLTSWQATTFLIGEYVEGELRDNPVFTVADGLFWLYQSVERNSIVRKMQVMKMRGQESVPGLHTFRITERGLQTFPRTFGLTDNKSEHVKGGRRLSSGVRELDALMGDGIPEGDSLLVAGPSGGGKTVLGIQFIAEGLGRGEPGIVAMFEELPNEFMQRAASFGFDLGKYLKDGTLKLIYLRPLDLSVDETVHEIVTAVKDIGCKRLVIDSLVGFEMALAPDFRTDFRESLYRMIGALTRLGVTIMSTVEVEENFTSMGLSNFTISFLADDILRLRYASINGQLRKIMMVVKMRRSQHSIDMCAYEVTSKGLAIGEPMRGYRALTSGIPGPWSLESGRNEPELSGPRNPVAGSPGSPRARSAKWLSTAAPDATIEQQLREMNDALLVSSVRQHEMAEQAQESADGYRTLFDLVPLAVYSCDASGVIQQFNNRAAELWGREPAPGDTDERFCGSHKMFRPDGSFMPHEQCPMAEVLSSKISELHDAEVLIERPDGSRIIVLVNIRALKNQRGEVTGAINCFVDITERKQTEARHALLAREVQHRSKNLLSVIQSIAERSMASGRRLEDARKAFIARLHALSLATDLLSDAGQGASMNDVVGRALDTFAGRFSIHGEPVVLNSGATQSFALVIHELCTNASKYGAYSTPGGRVAVRWSIEQTGNKPTLVFRWEERGGPPVIPPDHTSFGTTLLQLAIGGAETPPHINYAPEGFTYTFEVPLSDVAAIIN